MAEHPRILYWKCTRTKAFIFFLPPVKIFFSRFINSPELKAKWTFLLVHLSVCLSVRPSVCKLFTFFNFFCRISGTVSINLTQSIDWWMETLFKWRTMLFFSNGDNSELAKIFLTKFENALSQNYWVNFKQRAFLGEGNLQLFIWRTNFNHPVCIVIILLKFVHFTEMFFSANYVASGALVLVKSSKTV